MYVSRYIFDPNAGNGPVTPLPMRAGRAYLISTNAVARISGPNPEAKPFEPAQSFLPMDFEAFVVPPCSGEFLIQTIQFTWIVKLSRKHFSG